MLHLPKKHPWIILVIMYATIISVWITYFIVAHHRNAKHMTPQEAEQYFKEHPRQIANPESLPKTSPESATSDNPTIIK